MMHITLQFFFDLDVKVETTPSSNDTENDDGNSQVQSIIEKGSCLFFELRPAQLRNIGYRAKQRIPIGPTRSRHDAGGETEREDHPSRRVSRP